MKNCLNPECNKEINDDKKYCNENCLKRHLELKKQSEKVLEANNDVSGILRDGAFQNGIKWRKGKLEAIHLARKNGLSDKEILRELRLGGITAHKALELMAESEELFGR
jgi:hypothetical protein